MNLMNQAGAMMGPALKVRGRAASTKPDLRNFQEPQARAGRRGGESQTVRLRDADVRRASILPLMEGWGVVPADGGRGFEVNSGGNFGGAAHHEASMNDIRILMKTSKGDIALTLLASRTPVTVANFLNLTQRGYYNGLKFHRVIDNFMVQGGCPLGTGTGDAGYKFDDECFPDVKFDRPGLLAMANAGIRNGMGTNGSQFFITHVPTDWLNGKHTIFGAVTVGQDVVNAIRQNDTITSIEILDPTDDLLTAQAGRIAEWNKKLA
jgi:peptidyl-prolyl cis-trans isomerase B (cyclophilin B)